MSVIFSMGLSLYLTIALLHCSVRFIHSFSGGAFSAVPPGSGLSDDRFKELVPLRTEAELQLDFNPSLILPDNLLQAQWYDELMKQRKTSIGRESVQTALKTIQRLMLQLDRSDGRPDYSPGLLASRYYDFVGTCLRSQGGAWTAVLGPLEYVGLRIGDHVVDRQISGQTVRMVNVISLCAAMSACLLDLNLQEADAANRALKLSRDNVVNILDLGLALTRVAVRYAILKEDLTSHESTGRSSELGGTTDAETFSSLELCTTDHDLLPQQLSGGNNKYEEVVYPSSRRFHSILQFDLRLPDEDMPIKGASRIIVPRFLLKQWIEANALSPLQQS